MKYLVVQIFDLAHFDWRRMYHSGYELQETSLYTLHCNLIAVACVICDNPTIITGLTNIAYSQSTMSRLCRHVSLCSDRPSGYPV